MGGAERAERRRRQQQAAARAKPKGASDKTGKTGKAAKPAPVATIDKARARRVGLTVGGIAVLIAAVIGGIVWYDADQNATEGQVIAAKASAKVPEQREGAVVLVGDPKAPVTIDVYADFLCPACKQFEDRDAKAISAKVQAGDLRVRQHMVPMLAEVSDPAGYSMDSANAALCAADGGRFTAFHNSLYAAQPEEGKRGWDKGQLTALGVKLGLGEPFASCVAKRTYHAELAQSLKSATAEVPEFGTPAVLGPDGDRIDVSKAGWLDRLDG